MLLVYSSRGGGRNRGRAKYRNIPTGHVIIDLLPSNWQLPWELW